jgi:hypothetical protein
MATIVASTLPSNSAGAARPRPLAQGRVQAVGREPLADGNDGGHAHGVGHVLVGVPGVGPEEDLHAVPLAEREPPAEPPAQVRPLVVGQRHHVSLVHRTVLLDSTIRTTGTTGR